MKKRYIFIILAMLAAAGGCRRDNTEPVIGPNCPLEVSPSFSDMTDPDKPKQSRASADADAFKANDKVGLFMVNFANETTHGTLNGTETDVIKNQAHNREFTANTSGLLTAQPPVFFLKEFLWKVDIFAYYPYLAAWDTQADITKYPFVIKTDQNEVGNIAASDLCYAKTDASGLQPSAAPVALRFFHKLSKIEVSITLPDALNDGRKIEKIENMIFNDVKTNVTLNMTTGVVTTVATTKANVIPLLNNKVYEVIVPVQDFGTAANLFSFELKFATGGGANQQFAYKLPADVFNGNSTTTTAGMLHRINLTLTNSGQIELTGSDIIDWKTGITHPGDMTNQITTNFSVTLTGLTTPETINRVKVTTDESVTVYDIKNKDVAGSVVTTAAGVCTFHFTPQSGSPYDYGFKITKIEFLSDETSKGTATFNSARVYSLTTMNLGEQKPTI